jgi:nucleoid DNA-binding protein
MARMSHAAVVRHIASDSSVAAADVDAVLRSYGRVVSAHESVALIGVGRFRHAVLSARGARVGRNPRTGVEAVIEARPARVSIRFAQTRRLK